MPSASTIPRAPGPCFYDPIDDFEIQVRCAQRHPGEFPELSITLEKCLQLENPHDAVLCIFAIFLQFAFDVLDTLLYYSPEDDDEYPCECQFNAGLRCTLSAYTQLAHDWPEHLDRKMQSVILPFICVRGSYNFIAKFIIPWILREEGANKRTLGIRLTQCLAEMALKPNINLPEKTKAYFKYFDTLSDDTPYYRPPQVCELVTMMEIAMHMPMDELQDVRMVPCGPLIDIDEVTNPVSNPSNDEMCVICLEPLNQSPCIGVKACKHEIHKECLAGWANTRITTVTCPSCRGVVCEPRRVKPETCDCRGT